MNSSLSEASAGWSVLAWRAIFKRNEFVTFRKVCCRWKYFSVIKLLVVAGSCNEAAVELTNLERNKFVTFGKICCLSGSTFLWQNFWFLLRILCCDEVAVELTIFVRNKFRCICCPWKYLPVTKCLIVVQLCCSSPRNEFRFLRCVTNCANA